MSQESISLSGEPEVELAPLSVTTWLTNMGEFASPVAAFTSFNCDIITGRLGPERDLSLLVEQWVSVHILDDRNTTIESSQRAVQELLELDGRYVHNLRPWRLVMGSPISSISFVPLVNPTSGKVGEDERLVEARLFLDRIAHRLVQTPRDQWAREAISAFGEPSTKSPWAEAIGPVYSVHGLAAALNWSESQVRTAADSGVLLSISTVEGELLFPAQQIRRDGGVVSGLQWLIGELTSAGIDRYTLGAWMNSRKDSLGDRTVWESLQLFAGPNEELRRLVARFRSAALQ